MINFLNARREAEKLAGSVAAAERAVKLTSEQLNAGVTDFTPVFVASQFLAQDQLQLATAQSDIALGLITVYRALGGGWEIRCAGDATVVQGAPLTPAPPLMARFGKPYIPAEDPE